MNGISVSPDGKMLAVASSTGIRIYDAADFKAPPRVLLRGENILDVNFSPDGHALAAAGDTIQIIDLQSGRTSAVFRKDAGKPNRTAIFSPDGRSLISLSPLDTKPERISIWSIQSGRLQMSLPEDPDFVTAIALSHNGKYLASVDFARTLTVWDTATGNRVTTFKTAQQTWSLTFSTHDDALLSGENNGYIELWDSLSWALIKSLQKQSDEISSLCMSPDGKLLASASLDGSIILWDAQDWSSIRRIDSGVLRRRTKMEFSPKGETLYTGDDTSVRSWDFTNGNAIQQIEDFAGVINDLEFSENGGWLATSNDDGMIRIWNMHDSMPQFRLAVPSSQAMAVTFDPSGTNLFASGMSELIKIDLITRSVTKMFGKHPQPIFFIAYNAEYHRISASGLNGQVVVWNTSTSEKIADFNEDIQGNTGFNSVVGYSRDGKWMLTSGLKVLRLRNPQSGAIVGNIPIDIPYDVAFSPDSQAIAFTDRNDIVLWNIAKKSRDVILKNVHQPGKIAYSPDGFLLAASVRDGRDNSLILWNTKTGERVVVLNNLPAYPMKFAFSPDGRALAVGDNDGTVMFLGVSK